MTLQLPSSFFVRKYFDAWLYFCLNFFLNETVLSPLQESRTTWRYATSASRCCRRRWRDATQDQTGFNFTIAMLLKSLTVCVFENTVLLQIGVTQNIFITKWVCRERKCCELLINTFHEPILPKFFFPLLKKNFPFLPLS